MREAVPDEAAALIAEEPCWLVVMEREIAGLRLLSVYQSAWLTDGDQELEPVREFLSGRIHEVVCREELPDPNMVFGKGIWTLYALEQSCCNISPEVAEKLRVCGLNTIRTNRALAMS